MLFYSNHKRIWTFFDHFFGRKRIEEKEKKFNISAMLATLPPDKKKKKKQDRECLSTSAPSLVLDIPWSKEEDDKLRTYFEQ